MDGEATPGSDGDPTGAPPRWWSRWSASLLRFLRRRRDWLAVAALAGALLAVLSLHELRTSAFQARWFSEKTARLSYTVAAGESPAIVFPVHGPFDRQRGYTRIRDLAESLKAQGFEVTEQARFSPELVGYARDGLTPPVRFPTRAGLRLRGMAGTVLYERPREMVFDSFEAIPALARAAVLFVENRELLTPGDPRRNPAVEWDRALRVAVFQALGAVGFNFSRAGGSTLATQTEKYRHSAGGRTESVADKLRQMFAASLRAYRNGPDTRAARREILVDYLNSMPLSAAPGYGEVHGLGEGLGAWFGLGFEEAMTALADPAAPGQARTFRHVLALVCAVREPSRMLLTDRAGLDARVDSFVRLMSREGEITEDFASRVLAEATTFARRPPSSGLTAPAHRKPVDAARRELLTWLGAVDFYELDRIHVDVDTTLDADLQARVFELLMSLREPEVAARHGLQGPRMLREGRNDDVIFSFILYERTAAGPKLRVQADTSEGAFDLNEDMKLELGSTAKLRTLVHYLELIARLRAELSAVAPAGGAEGDGRPKDPLTRWVARTLAQRPGITEAEILDAALDRPYSASPGPGFFTGGGVHHFHNFSNREDAMVPSVREATWRSTNLVFIRLMEDLMRYHRARLPYDADAVLRDPANAGRRALLQRVVEEESQQALDRAFVRFRGVPRDDLAATLLGTKARSPRHLAILHAAWTQGPITEEGLAAWLAAQAGEAARAQAPRLLRAYSNPRLTLADFAYLLGRRPLDVWVAGELYRDQGLSLADLRGRSAASREVAWAWLLKGRNRSAQDRRLRILAERDAFRAMQPHWQRLGFPFELVPSLATSIGSSADRPAALADLVRILQADGLRTRPRRTNVLRLAEGTPYHTTLLASRAVGERVLSPAVAQAARAAMVGVVEKGTARRLAGAFVLPNGVVVPAGGKTGSGDNRLGGRAVDRTATFTFFIGDRYHGAMTAYVAGPGAARHHFTSGLVVAILKLAAPAIVERLAAAPPPTLPSHGATGPALPARPRVAGRTTQ